MTTDLSRCENGDITYRMSREDGKIPLAKMKGRMKSILGETRSLQTAAKRVQRLTEFFLSFLKRIMASSLPSFPGMRVGVFKR